WSTRGSSRAASRTTCRPSARRSSRSSARGSTRSSPRRRAARRGKLPDLSRCFVTRRLPDEMVGPLAGEHELDVWPESATGPSPGDLLAHAREADGLLTMLTDVVDASFLDACPRLRAISNFAVG